MAAIKKFFQKKKMDIKFKTAGSGHRLTEDTRSIPQASTSSNQTPRGHQPQTEEQVRAAQAAMARMNTKSGGGAVMGSSMATIKAQVRQERASAKKEQEKASKLADVYAPQVEVDASNTPALAVSGVWWRCPLIGDKAYERSELEQHIETFLLSQLGEEPAMTSALMIYTLNKDKARVQVACDVLHKYLENIAQHPAEEKYRKIRLNNKVFKEKVSELQGTNEFLQAAGFMQASLPGPEGVEEPYYVMDADTAANTETLRNLQEILSNAEPIKPELHHDRQVFYPSHVAERMVIPDNFYSMSPAELKKEQQLRNEAVERLGMLRTKEMREREKQRELRKYRFTLVRVRFPDGVILQGTFRALDKLSSLLDFIRESLEHDWIPFHLTTGTGQKLTEEDTSLTELNLAPAVVVNFSFDPALQREIAAQKGGLEEVVYLKEEYMTQIKSL